MIYTVCDYFHTFKEEGVFHTRWVWWKPVAMVTSYGIIRTWDEPIFVNNQRPFGLRHVKPFPIIQCAKLSRCLCDENRKARNKIVVVIIRSFVPVSTVINWGGSRSLFCKVVLACSIGHLKNVKSCVTWNSFFLFRNLPFEQDKMTAVFDLIMTGG